LFALFRQLLHSLAAAASLATQVLGGGTNRAAASACFGAGFGTGFGTGFCGGFAAGFGAGFCAALTAAAGVSGAARRFAAEGRVLRSS
jgi:hypothetical protein